MVKSTPPASAQQEKTEIQSGITGDIPLPKDSSEQTNTSPTSAGEIPLKLRENNFFNNLNSDSGQSGTPSNPAELTDVKDFIPPNDSSDLQASISNGPIKFGMSEPMKLGGELEDPEKDSPVLQGSNSNKSISYESLEEDYEDDFQ